jgi:hypothetical protein
MTPQGSLDLSFKAVSRDFQLRGMWFFVSLFCVGIIYAGYRGCLFVGGKRIVWDRGSKFKLGILFLLLVLLTYILGMVLIFVATLVASIITWINFFCTKKQ